MRTTRNFLLPLAFLPICFNALAADRAATTATDEQITAEVKRVLTSDNETQGNKINVQTRGGVVQLSGFIESGRMKAAATSAARSVPGVKEVRDDLIVREGERSLAQGGEDSVIAAKVKSVIEDRSHGADDVSVDVRAGVVQLSGFVGTPDRKSQVERMARDVDGVTDVRNDIHVASER